MLIPETLKKSKEKLIHHKIVIMASLCSQWWLNKINNNLPHQVECHHLQAECLHHQHNNIKLNKKMMIFMDKNLYFSQKIGKKKEEETWTCLVAILRNLFLKMLKLIIMQDLQVCLDQWMKNLLFQMACLVVMLWKRMSQIKTKKDQLKIN